MPPLPEPCRNGCCRGGIYPALILSLLRCSRSIEQALWCRRLACTIPLISKKCGRACPGVAQRAKRKRPHHKGARTVLLASGIRLRPGGLRRDCLFPPEGGNKQKNRAWRPGKIRDKKLVVGSRSFQRLLNIGRRRMSRLRMTRGPVRRRTAQNPILFDRSNQPRWRRRDVLRCNDSPG
jgi:hypothetical protein